MSHRLPALAPRILERRLENGLRLVLLPDPSSSLVAVNLWYHVGSKNDPRGRTGLAHLFEHMLFQGSQHVRANDHFRLIQQVGGVANGSTSFDRTNYYETLPPHCLELGLWLESDRLGFFLPTLDESKFEAQRSVVINERRERIDNQPYGRTFETLQAALFGDDHPYGSPIIGQMGDLETATLADVRSFFDGYYRPNNAVLTLAGNLDADRAEALVRAYFDEIPSAPIPPGPRMPPTRSQPTSLQLADEVALTRVHLAWVGPPFSEPGRYAGELLAGTLAGGKSSPAFQRLVHDEQIAQDVSFLLLPLESSSVFLAAATVRPGLEPQRVEAELRSLIAAAAEKGVEDRDLERTRNQALTALFAELESVESVADLLSQFAVLSGDPRQIDREPRRYLSVSREELTEFARRFLSPDLSVGLHVVPRGEAETGH